MAKKTQAKKKTKAVKKSKAKKKTKKAKKSTSKKKKTKIVRKKKIVRKPKKVFELTWAFENFEEHETFYTKRMFGGMAAYVHGKMVMLLTESPGERSWRDQTFDYDIWNGILFPTEYEYQESLIEDFPCLIQHVVLKKWLFLPLETDNFEDYVNEISLKIRRKDKRFGIFPKI